MCKGGDPKERREEGGDGGGTDYCRTLTHSYVPVPDGNKKQTKEVIE